MNFIEWITNLAQISLWITALVFIGIYILKPILMFVPLPMLYVVAGIVFPTWIALIITFGGVMLALISGYYSGKFLSKRKVNGYLGKNIKIGRFIDSRGKNFLSFCFVYRVLPLPFDLFNMMCGVLKVSLWKYLIVSVLGLSVTIIPQILVGANIKDPLSSQFLFPFIVSLAFMSGMFVLHKRNLGK